MQFFNSIFNLLYSGEFQFFNKLEEILNQWKKVYLDLHNFSSKRQLFLKVEYFKSN